MAVLALELNDAGIVAVRDSAPKVLALPESPGIAVVDGDNIVTGSEARTRLRLTPRFTHTRFWDALDTTPLSRPFPSQLSRADLAHAHLSHLWKEAEGQGANYDRAVLAVPGWYSLDQLGLILGMARAIGIAVGCMMDAALAAAAGVTQGSRSCPPRSAPPSRFGNQHPPRQEARPREHARQRGRRPRSTPGRVGHTRRAILRSTDALRPAPLGRERAEALRRAPGMARRALRRRRRNAPDGIGRKATCHRASESANRRCRASLLRAHHVARGDVDAQRRARDALDRAPACRATRPRRKARPRRLREHHRASGHRGRVGRASL